MSNPYCDCPAYTERGKKIERLTAELAEARAASNELLDNRNYWMESAQMAETLRSGTNLQLKQVQASLAEARAGNERLVKTGLALTAERDRLAEAERVIELHYATPKPCGHDFDCICASDAARAFRSRTGGVDKL